jgi:ATP-dependent helicase HrpA
VGIRLFLDPVEALERTQEGARELLASSLTRELAYLKKHCLPPDLPGVVSLSLGGREKLQARISTFLARKLMGSWSHVPGRDELTRRLEDLRKTLYQQALPVIELLREVFEARAAAQRDIQRLKGRSSGNGQRNALHGKLQSELLRLTPPDFPAQARLSGLENLPRRLRALSIRAQRAHADPMKDRTKAARIEPFLAGLADAEAAVGDRHDPEGRAALNAFQELLEEYRVSVFAPELGTATPVSPKRLREAWERVHALL